MPSQKFYSRYYPVDWDKFYESRENSLYYTLLVKHVGLEKANYLWDHRHRVNNDEYLWDQVKDYKPANPLNVFGDLYWGYTSLTDSLEGPPDAINAP